MSQAARNEILASTAASSTGPAQPRPREVTSLVDLLEGEEARAFAELRAALEARFEPSDAAERLIVEAMAAAFWRQRRLDVLEERVLAALASGQPLQGMPSLATLARCRARLERDLQAAEARLAQLKGQRAQANADLEQALCELERLAAALGERPLAVEDTEMPPAEDSERPVTTVAQAGRDGWNEEPSRAMDGALARAGLNRASGQAAPGDARSIAGARANRIERALAA